ncbi:hypothetical protein FXO38_02113 [Capsicum annuum]|nr:hypothetical protein FXO38_02113 [Capsicum annuum]
MGTLHLEFGLILQLSQVFYCFVFSGDQLSKCSLETMAANALWKLWHRRWGHPYTQNLKSICSSGDLVFKIDFKNNVTIICDYCVLAKSHLLSFNNSIHRTNSPFELIHYDVWESINIIFHSTALSSYFDDEPDPNVRVPLVAPPPSPFQIQVVVEQKITRKRNLTRHDIDRENFVAECFTMDEKRSKAVAEAFVRLSNKGLVYRHKIQSPSWEFSIHPFNGRKLPIVCDEKLVDMNFGTGAVKMLFDLPSSYRLPSCQWIVSTLNKAIGRTVSFLESYDLFNAASENVEDEMDKVLPIVKGLRSKRVSGGRICKVSSDSDASPTEWLTEVVEVGDESVIVSL